MSHVDLESPFASRHFETLSLNKKGVLLLTSGAGLHDLSGSECELLTMSQQFATLQDHARRIVNMMNTEESRSSRPVSPNGRLGFRDRLHAYVLSHPKTNEEHVSRIYSQLLVLAQRGLLGSRTEWLGAFADAEDTRSAPVALNTICVPTAGRPTALLRCIRSYVRNAAAFGHDIRVVVADSSQDRSVARANIEMLDLLSKELRVEIQYAGCEEKRAYADRMQAHTGIPADLIRFALLDEFGFGIPTGANRNTLLLECAGSAFYSVDDDTVCHTVAPPESRSGAALVTETEPTDYWFYDSRNKALSMSVTKEIDILEVQATVLGKKLAEVINRIPTDNIDVSLARPSAIDIRSVSGATIAITVPGVVGDSGIFSAVGLLFHPSHTTRERLLQSEETYREALSSREICRAATTATLSYGSPLIGTTIGINASDIIPPFMPIGRSQDSVFGVTLNRCSPTSWHAHLPIAILHDTEPGRTYMPALKSAGIIRLADVLNALILCCPLEEINGEVRRRLQRLGQYLSSVGRLAPEQFEDLVVRKCCHVVATRCSRLERMLIEYGHEPRFWAEDLRQYLDASYGALHSRLHIVPHDLSASVGMESARAATQRTVEEFGRVLECWPTLFQATRECGHGNRIARHLRDLS